MDKFLGSNPGLQRRIECVVDFDDYTVGDLVDILLMSIPSPYRFDASIDKAALLELLEHHTTPHLRSKYNGGLCALVRKELDHSLVRRLNLSRNPTSGSAAELVPEGERMTYTREDLVRALERISRSPRG